MLPSQQFSTQNASALTSLYPQDAASPTYLQYVQPQNMSVLSNMDVNSPAVFKQNMHFVMQHIARVQSLIQTNLNGIQNAYSAGSTPTQAEADIATLKQSISVLIDLLHQSGVGGLPLLSLPANTTAGGMQVMHDPVPVPTEQEIITSATSSLNELYQRQTRIQQSAALPATRLDPQRPA